MQQYEYYAERLKSDLHKNGVYIDGIYCCPHGRGDHCSCKKPLPGLIEQAINDFDIDFNSSYMVGDMGCTDMKLAKQLGVKVF